MDKVELDSHWLNLQQWKDSIQAGEETLKCNKE